MNSQQAAIAALMNGMTLPDLSEALEHPVPGKCFWLAHHCGEPTAPGDWLCPEHRAWTPDLGGAEVPPC